MSRETLLASLHPDRLPDTAAGGLFAEAFVAIGFGLICGALLANLLPKRQSLRSRLRALAGLAPEERRLALLYLLRDHKPGQIAQWRARLYRPGQMPNSDEIEGHLR